MKRASLSTRNNKVSKEEAEKKSREEKRNLAIIRLVYKDLRARRADDDCKQSRLSIKLLFQDVRQAVRGALRALRDAEARTGVHRDSVDCGDLTGAFVNQTKWMELNQGVDERGFTLSLTNVGKHCGMPEDDTRLGIGYLYQRLLDKANPEKRLTIGTDRLENEARNKKLRKLEFIECLPKVAAWLTDAKQPAQSRPVGWGSDSMKAAVNLANLLVELDPKKAWKACARCAPPEEVQKASEARGSFSMNAIVKAKRILRLRKGPSVDEMKSRLDGLWAKLIVDCSSDEEEPNLENQNPSKILQNSRKTFPKFSQNRTKTPAEEKDEEEPADEKGELAEKLQRTMLLGRAQNKTRSQTVDEVDEDYEDFRLRIRRYQEEAEQVSEEKPRYGRGHTGRAWSPTGMAEAIRDELGARPVWQGPYGTSSPSAEEKPIETKTLSAKAPLTHTWGPTLPIQSSRGSGNLSTHNVKYRLQALRTSKASAQFYTLTGKIALEVYTKEGKYSFGQMSKVAEPDAEESSKTGDVPYREQGNVSIIKESSRNSGFQASSRKSRKSNVGRPSGARRSPIMPIAGEQSESADNLHGTFSPQDAAVQRILMRFRRVPALRRQSKGNGSFVSKAPVVGRFTTSKVYSMNDSSCF